MTGSAITRLALCIQANVPALWWGRPGIGKTSILNELGGPLGFSSVECISPATRQPEDIGGIPVPDMKGTNRAHRLYEDWAVNCHDRPTLLCIDELNRASSRATLNAALRVFQERQIGDLSMHPGTRLLATANPPDTDSGAAEIPAALANRLYHEYAEVDTDQWLNWLMGGSGALTNIPRLPAGWEDNIGTARAQIGGFVNVKRNIEHMVPKDPVQASGPYPTRRSWTNAATLWAAGGLAYGSVDEGIKLVAGCVGEGPAMEFMAYIKDSDLPDPKDLLDNPADFKIPRRADQTFAILGSCVSLARRRGTVEAFRAMEEIVVRAAEGGARDAGGAAVAALMGPSGAGAAVILPPKGWMLGTKMALTYKPVLEAAGMMGRRS
jgi:hypothetical protein